MRRPPVPRKGSLRRKRILREVPPRAKNRYFKSGVFFRSGVILTLFIPAGFYKNREIDLFTRIARHKRTKTLIFASDFALFTSVSPNRANRTLTDRESRIRSGCGACVPTAGSMDRGGYVANTNERLTCHWLLRIFLERVFWKLFRNFFHAEKKFERNTK